MPGGGNPDPAVFPGPQHRDLAEPAPLVAVPADMQDHLAALQRWYYVTYRKRLPSLRSRNRLRIVFGFARQALIAACHEGPWWQT